MSKLEDLVPPPQLCYDIGVNDFADSALVWNTRCSPDKILLIRREEWDHGGYITPAPTLAEIFAQLPQTSTVTWFTQEEYPNEFAVCCYVLQPKPRKPKLKSEIDDNPAVAAMKLWLELKGMK